MINPIRLTTIVALMLFVSACSYGQAPTGSNTATPSHFQETHIINRAVLYMLEEKSKATISPTWFCFVPSKFGGDALIDSNLRSAGVNLIDSNWFWTGQHQPKHVVVVEVEDLQWITSRRVKVVSYLAWDLNSQSLAESQATVYLNRVQKAWRVDPKDTTIVVEEE